MGIVSITLMTVVVFVTGFVFGYYVGEGVGKEMNKLETGGGGGGSIHGPMCRCGHPEHTHLTEDRVKDTGYSAGCQMCDCQHFEKPEVGND